MHIMVKWNKLCNNNNEILIIVYVGNITYILQISAGAQLNGYIIL